MKARFTRTESTEKNTLVVSGELAATANEQFRIELHSLLHNKGTLELSLAEVHAMDIVSIELTYCFVKLARKRNCNFLVIPPRDYPLNTLLSRTGLMNALAGRHNNELKD